MQDWPSPVLTTAQALLPELMVQGLSAAKKVPLVQSAAPASLRSTCATAPPSIFPTTRNSDFRVGLASLTSFNEQYRASKEDVKYCPMANSKGN